MHKNSMLFQNKVFGMIAVATALVLTVPLVAMQFTRDVNWTISDFAIMGLLIFGMASLFVLVARKVPRKYRLAVGVAFGAAFLYVWAELAVGVFTSIGS